MLRHLVMLTAGKNVIEQHDDGTQWSVEAARIELGDLEQSLVTDTIAAAAVIRARTHALSQQESNVAAVTVECQSQGAFQAIAIVRIVAAFRGWDWNERAAALDLVRRELPAQRHGDRADGLLSVATQALADRLALDL